MRDMLLLAIAVKVIVFVVLWGVGHLALVVMIGLPLTGLQVGGGALVLALLMPVKIERRRRW